MNNPLLKLKSFFSNQIQQKFNGQQNHYFHQYNNKEEVVTIFFFLAKWQ